MDVEHARRVRLGEAERLGLLVVVLEDERGHVVGHLHEQRVALLLGQVAGLDHGVQQDLDVHLAVRAVDPARVVDRVGVHAPARERELHAPGLRHAEVAALADHLGAQLGGVHAHGVVGLVAGVGVRLGARPSRRCRCRRSRAGPPARAAAPGSARSASAPRPRCRAPSRASSESGIDFARARRRRRRRPRSPRGRSRPTTSRAARTAAGAPRSSRSASGFGSMNTCRWLNAPTSRMCAREQHPVAEHVARHVADADDGEVLATGCRGPARGSGASPTPTRRAR